MGKNLIIVESPAKVRTIGKFLGREYTVEASVGHVRDLPAKSLGVDEESFAPEYEIIPGKEKVVARLKKAAAAADAVFLAPDPDREGEAIAWHVYELIKAKSGTIRRIQFNEITARAVREALEHPRDLDERLFNSQQARRVLDRIVGYKVSPLLWKKVKRGISAGRVQSVALKIIVEREKERLAFEPVEYWVFKAGVTGPRPPAFDLELWKVDGKPAAVGSEAQARVLEKDVKAATFTVSSVEEKERAKNPAPPFITSTLQQEASRRLGFSAKKTMSTAQRLYEGVDLGEAGTTALITYMRTDSVRIAAEARQAAQELIAAMFGDDHLPAKPRAFKSKASAQEAHEAIRPVDPAITPEQVKGLLPADQRRLYTLVWQRFMASQMASARYHDTLVTAEAGRTLWRAKGERLLFPGWLAAFGQAVAAEGEGPELPLLARGETLDLKCLTVEQKFTQPPPRYSEASLVKELEDKGIGRPSTYAQIISTLIDREYVRLAEKRFVPTDLGTVVSELLSTHFENLMDVNFTARMEDSLDKVAEGVQDWSALLAEFAKDFNLALDKARKEMAQVKTGIETGMLCETCGKPMAIKFGKAGTFLACTGYPACTTTRNFVRNEAGEIEIVLRERIEPEKTGRTCPKCGQTELVIKRSRTGSRFVACPRYPECDHAEPFAMGVACPREGCPGQIVEKSTRKGKVFYSCSEYPRCDFALWNPPVAEACPECGFPLLERKSTRAKGEHLACPSGKCRYVRTTGEE
jgi:DNA topoisomerase-1